MRDYTFRGRDMFGVWHEGELSERNNCPTIWPKGDRSPVGYYVDRETVGQYIGLTDVDGEKVFEGTFVKFTFENGDEDLPNEEIVLFDFVEEWNAVSLLQTTLPISKQSYDMPLQKHMYEWRAEVVGNKWDNPELLGVLK